MRILRFAILVDVLRRPVRLHRLQFSLRDLIGMIAVVAFALGATTLCQRSQRYEQSAVFHEMEERRWHEAELSHQANADAIRDDRAGHKERVKNGTAILNEQRFEEWLEEHLSMARDSSAQAAHHSRLKNAYRTLARQPWRRPDDLVGK
jgi:hypothetical protein